MAFHLQPKPLSRREFLKFSSLALACLGFSHPWARLPLGKREIPIGIGRVTASAIRVYKEPSFQSEKLDWLRRDTLLKLPEEIISPHGPQHNPRWYRVAGGFCHSGYIQRVEKAHFNTLLETIPEGGQLGEVTVPYTKSYRYTRYSGWQPLYRLYFTSAYWITSLDEGPDGRPWYGLTDDRLRVVYHVPAAHIRPIPDEEITPISPHVPSEDKRIQVLLEKQKLVAYEGDHVVWQADISSGIPTRNPPPNGIPTDTPQGKFKISLKFPSRHMGEGQLTSDPEAYELPGVPWVSIFHTYGIGFHGTYWHDNFGTRMSHGCVNLRNEDARWLFRWTTPEINSRDWYKQGRGTLIHVY